MWGTIDPRRHSVTGPNRIKQSIKVYENKVLKNIFGPKHGMEDDELA